MSTVNGGYPAPVQPHGRRQRYRDDNGSKSARTACDFFVFLDVCATIAFVIAGLSSQTWVFYGTNTDYYIGSNNGSWWSSTPYFFNRTRGLWQVCPQSSQSNINGQSCMNLNLGYGSNVVDVNFWNIINMRRTEIALFIIVVILSGVALLVHIFCCIPSARHTIAHGFWKNSIISGVLCGVAAALQLIGMIVFQADMYYEVTYVGSNCADCQGSWPTSTTTGLVQNTSQYGVGYALGWCAAGLLVYACVAYLMREFCVVRGCRPPGNEPEDDMQNLEIASGVSSTAPYLKGSARDMQIQQVNAAPRLNRYDIGNLNQVYNAQPSVPSVYGAGRNNDLY